MKASVHILPCVSSIVRRRTTFPAVSGVMGVLPLSNCTATVGETVGAVIVGVLVFVGGLGVGDEFAVVTPQALNASKRKMCKRMENCRFIESFPLWHLLRFDLSPDIHHFHSVYLAAVIRVKGELVIEYEKLVFGNGN